MQPIQFTATIEKNSTKGGWHYMRLSPDVLKKLREIVGENGNVPVVVTIGKTSWLSTIMSMGEQRWFVAVGVGVRKIENIAEGDRVSVVIAPDFDRLSQ